MSAIDSILTTEQYRTEQANAMYKNGDDDDKNGGPIPTVPMGEFNPAAQQNENDENSHMQYLE